MIKKILISIVAIVVGYMASAQDLTIPATTNDGVDAVIEPIPVMEEQVQYDKVLVIPFEPKLYRSEADRDINKRTGLTPQGIRNNFRLGINNHVLHEAIQVRPAMSLLSEDPEMHQDLVYVYKSLGYNYASMPVEEKEPEQSKAKEVFTKLKTKTNEAIYGPQETEREGTWVKEGQLYTIQPKAERFMKSRAVNPAIFDYLSSKYEVGYFVIINQFEINIAPNTEQKNLQRGVYQRELKVHYTIFNQAGEEVYASAAKNLIPAIANDMNVIIKGYFPKVAKEVAFHIPSIQLTAAQQQKIEQDEKKAAEQREESRSIYNPGSTSGK